MSKEREKNGQVSDQLITGQIQLYEMIASGKPLKETLKELVLFIESHTPEMICTILLLDEDGQRMWTGAGPNFPIGLSAAIDGSSIGPKAGSCGTAAYRGENVFVEDIQTDPLWADYKMVFLLHGLRACWSSPIFDEQHRVLGTFAMYFREPALPEEHDLELIDIATRIASVCIQRKRADQALRRSERRLSVIYENISESIFLIAVQPDFRFHYASVNKAFLLSNDLRIEQVIGNDVERVLPPSTHQLVLSKFREAIQEKRSVQWEQGTVHHGGKKIMAVTINPVFDERGVCTNLVGNAHELALNEDR
jgi:PAS domain S-box-containing protein